MSYQVALILTGPKDGELIDHWNDILEIPVVPKIKPLAGRHRSILADLPSIKALTFVRHRFGVAQEFVRPIEFFVPIEWPLFERNNKIIAWLIRRAFMQARTR